MLSPAQPERAVGLAGRNLNLFQALPDKDLDLRPSKGPINPDSIMRLNLPVGEPQVRPAEIESDCDKSLAVLRLAR